MKNSIASRIVASSLAASLIITAPGLPFYSAFAQTDPMGKVVAPVAQGGSGIVINAGVPGAGQTSEKGSSYNGLNGQRTDAKFNAKKFGVTANTPSPEPSARPLPSGEEYSYAESEDYGALSQEQVQVSAQGQLKDAAAFPMAAPASNPGIVAAAPFRAMIGGKIGNRVAEDANVEKKGLIRTKIDQLKKLFKSADVPKLEAGSAPSVAANASTPLSTEDVIFTPELKADKDYNAGLTSVRTWTPGTAVEFKAPKFALRGQVEAKKEKFNTGVAHGIWEKTQDWSQVPVFYKKLNEGQPIDGILEGMFPAAPKTGPPAEIVPAAKSKGFLRPTPEKSVWWFLGGLLVAQVGIEALGIAMPMMMRDRFGGFGAMAQIAVFSSLASMMGRLTGSGIADKFGLKTTYITTTIIRLMSISAMIGFLLGPGAIPGAASWIIAHHGAIWGGNIVNGVAQMVLPLLTNVDAWITGTGFFGLNPFAVLTGFYSFNGFVAGVSLTAEMSLPQAMLGNHRAVLERFFALEQWLMEIVGSAGPKLGGKVIEHHGFIPALLIYPVSFAVAIGLFIFGIQLPAKSPDTKDGEAATEAKKPVAPPMGFFKRVGAGASIVFKNPVMRTAFLGYTAYMILNPLLYSILGPAFGLHMSGGDAKIGSDVASWITALYSFGGLFGGLVMWREGMLIQETKEKGDGHDGLRLPAILETIGKVLSHPLDSLLAGVKALYAMSVAWVKGFMAALLSKWNVIAAAAYVGKTAFKIVKSAMLTLAMAIDVVVLNSYLGAWLDKGREKKTGKLTEDGEKVILKDSTLLWMMLGTVGLGSFGTLLMATPVPAYGAMMVFGIAQVIANLKLRTLAMSEATADQRTLVNAFLGAASTGLIAVMLNMTGKLFDTFNGVTPFMYFDGALMGLGATYVWITQTLKRHSEEPGTDPGLKMRVLGIVLSMMYASLGSYALYMIGHGLYGIIGSHAPAVIAWIQHLFH